MSIAFRLTAFAMTAGVLLACSVDLTPPGKRYGLVYGITTYTTNQLTVGSPNLGYPAIDAISVGQMLAAKGYEEVRLRYRDPTHDDSPTKANLIADMNYFASIIGPDDTFVFYYSGHGTSVGGNKYIIPYLGVDGVPSYGLNLGNCVNQDELETYLNAINTARKIVILDSCYSGGFVGNPLEVDLTPPGYINMTNAIMPEVIAQAIKNYAGFSSSGTEGVSPYGNAIVISAAGSNEFSFEDGAPFSHGIATYFLLQAPASGDLNHDGVVTAMEIFSLIKAGVDNEWNAYAYVAPGISSTNPNPNYHDTFAPHISGGPLDYVMFR